MDNRKRLSSEQIVEKVHRCIASCTNRYQLQTTYQWATRIIKNEEILFHLRVLCTRMYNAKGMTPTAEQERYVCRPPKTIWNS